MKTMYVRVAAFFIVTLFGVGMTAQVENRDFGIGGGGGAGNCAKCYMNAYNPGGSITLACIAPDPGDMGSEYCWIENYPEGSYCFAEGNACCID